MHQQLLLPNKFKKAGWIILLTGLIAAIIVLAGSYEPSIFNVTVFSIFNEDADNGFSTLMKNNITDEILTGLIIIGGLLVGFSKEKEEDELIVMVRMNSLLWAVFINSVILLVASLFIYELSFVRVMMYNMFTVLLLFIGIFNFILYTKIKRKTQ